MPERRQPTGDRPHTAALALLVRSPSRGRQSTGHAPQPARDFCVASLLIFGSGTPHGSLCLPHQKIPVSLKETGDPHSAGSSANTQVQPLRLVRRGGGDMTICRKGGYTSGIRPSTSITGREKELNAASYGFTGSMRDAEYDHLLSGVATL